MSRAVGCGVCKSIPGEWCDYAEVEGGTVYDAPVYFNIYCVGDGHSWHFRAKTHKEVVKQWNVWNKGVGKC